MGLKSLNPCLKGIVPFALNQRQEKYNFANLQKFGNEGVTPVSRICNRIFVDFWKVVFFIFDEVTDDGFNGIRVNQFFMLSVDLFCIGIVNFDHPVCIGFN